MYSLPLADGLLRESGPHGDDHVVRHAPHEDAAVARRRDQVLAVRREPAQHTTELATGTLQASIHKRVDDLLKKDS